VRSKAIVSLAVAVLATSGCGDDDEDEGGQAKTSAATAGGCKRVDQPAPKQDARAPKLRTELDPGKTYHVRFRTSCGEFAVALDVKGSPKTAASFASLARSGFFAGTFFHRIVPGFVVQGGDPTGTGTGGPGYKTVERPPRDARYAKGVVAMAKGGDERPGTAGSQFFVVTGDDAGLPPEYAIAGKVSAGLDVVERIGRLGDPSTEEPTQPVVIEAAAVEER
jgi:peptidyl-prolyl cis-trans isomerase B (cyclophilin B)